MAIIAFVGLGTMGQPMAQVLRAAGHDVLGVDVSPQMRARFSGAVEPSAEAIAQAEIIVTMLPEGRHVTQVHTDIILKGAAAGALLIDCSTIDVDTARDLAAQAEAKGLVMLDAPVSGGPAGAETGSLSFMVGGSNEAFAKARPVLEAMGAKITHFGPAGSGQAAKACHNMICGITAMAVMEGFALADALELDLHKFYALCAGAAAQSWTLENRCPIPGVVPLAPSSNDFAPGFASALMAKDLRLAQAAASSTGQATPFGAEAARAFTEFAEADGGLDFSAIYKTLRALPDQRQD
ncbi:3-hydroxyisobutyrate dehydrogenase [Sulfitobacter aestuariivivens]|uniref:3-hydroxyisobutyrate dehydrogenase n=1 Tax=Sulfitobacter aestuariivivens TaxID=2766981 RepID=A0A927D8T8_9RHOB|nr:3-hydroxyisobutyrate dehydrogenase [Sulfitobacter aestuariivivens]MBD3666253.1 3-hydroxyisobutyrate dehydrogenase [Sulfitobacter aestuariivivens]